jgi:SAM-dependent methyltransferase
MNKHIKSVAFKGLSIYSDMRNMFRSKKDIFDEMYKKRGWGNEETLSGTGSTVKNTEKLVRLLPTIFSQYKIDSVLDIPCGDFNWMKEVEMGGIKYYGADIVEALIERNKKLYTKNAYSFFVADVTTSVLPNVDFILCRDCLVHLSYKDIFAALRNIRDSHTKYLLTTTFPGHQNVNIVTGNWRPINLGASPFNFPKALHVYYEDYSAIKGEYGDKALGLWNVTDIPRNF